MPQSVGYAHWHYNADVANARNVGGWAWSEGEVFDFVGHAALRDDVLWLTNLPWEYHIALGCHGSPHIKRSDFLPVPLERLTQELNITPDDKALFGNAIAVIGSRLIVLAHQSYGKKVIDYCMRYNTIAQAIAHALGSPQVTDDIQNHEVHSDIVWQNLAPHAVLQHKVQRENCAVLRAPFFAHAQHVLTCPLPSIAEEWIEIEVEPSQRLKYLRAEELPVIVEVLDVALTSSMSNLYDFSSTPHRWSRRRKWMCSTEVIFLADSGGVEIGRMFIQPAGYVCDALTWSLPQAGAALALSLSAGLLAHAHWLSGAIPLTHRFWPARGMWLRTADRLKLAATLPALGGIKELQIIGYGEGAVSIFGSPDAIAEAIWRAPNIGLAPTSSTWAATTDRSAVQDPDWLPASASPYEVAALRLSHRPIADILRLDAASIYSLTDEKSAIREIALLIKEYQHHV